MRKTLLTVVLGAAAACAFAQNRQPQQQTVPQQPEQLDKQTQERIRAERSAGGARPTTPEERQGAAAGEGPHRQFNPGGEGSRSHDEGSSERQAGRGARR